MSSVKPTPGERLRAESLFRHCRRASLAKLLSHASECSLAAGEPLYDAGQPALQAYLLIDGEIELTGPDGKPQTLRGGWIGLEGALDLPIYEHSARPTQDTRVLGISTHALRELVQESSDLRQRLLDLHLNGQGLAEDEGTAERLPDNILGPSAGWLLTLTLPLLLFFMLTRWLPATEQLAWPSAVFVAVGSCAVIMWVFRLLPEFVPALFAVLSLILLGVVPAEVALSGFMSSSFFIALSIFGLSVVITHSGLSYRLLLTLLRIGPATRSWQRVSLFLTGLALTPAVPSTDGRVAILGPVMRTLHADLDKENAARESRSLFAATLGGVSLLSAAFLSSKTINFVAFGYLPAQDQTQFQWLYWLYAASLVSVVSLVLYAINSWLFFRGPQSAAPDKGVIADQLRLLGPLSNQEWAGLAGIVILLGAFLTANQHQIGLALVALALLLALLSYGILTHDSFRRSIDWSYLVFLACLIGMVATMQYTHVDKWATERLQWLSGLMAHNLTGFVLMLSLAIALVRLALPINPTVILFATALIPTAINIGVNPWLVAFLILFLAETALLPYQAGYYLQLKAFTPADGPTDASRLLLFNLATYLIKIVAVFASFPFWRHLGLL